MRGRLAKWVIALTITIGVPVGLVLAFMPFLDISHATYLTAVGDFPAALRALNRALSINPGNALTYVQRSFVFDQLGEPGRAFADADNAVSLDVDSWSAFNNRAWSQSQLPGGDLKRAFRDANRAVSLCPSCAAAFDTRGFVEFKQNHLEDALADFNRALQLDPGLKESYLHRTLVLQLLNEGGKTHSGKEPPKGSGTAQSNAASG